MKDFLDWIYKNYGVTLLIVAILLSLFVAVTLKVFFWPVDIPTGTVAAYGTFFALASITIGLWQWRRAQKGKGGGDDGDSG